MPVVAQRLALATPPVPRSRSIRPTPVAGRRPAAVLQRKRSSCRPSWPIHRRSRLCGRRLLRRQPAQLYLRRRHRAPPHLRHRRTWPHRPRLLSAASRRTWCGWVWVLRSKRTVAPRLASCDYPRCRGNGVRSNVIWMVLPEDLRSELLTSYGRGELTNYHRNLLRAVEFGVTRAFGVFAPDEG